MKFAKFLLVYCFKKLAIAIGVIIAFNLFLAWIIGWIPVPGLQVFVIIHEDLNIWIKIGLMAYWWAPLVYFAAQDIKKKYKENK